MALGAQPGEILRMVLTKGAALIAAGIALGLVVSFGLARFLESLLWAVSATDSLTFASVAVVLALAGPAACALPARRAAGVLPMVALRYE
jgi:ABC-type antimicrobial peptide transport system permease subunit